MDNRLENIKYYINGIVMLFGVFSYLILALLMTANLNIENKLLIEILGVIILGIGMFSITLAYGFTVGVLVAIYQLFWGIYYKIFKKSLEDKYTHSILSAGLWLLGLIIFYIGTSFGLIVTV